MGTTLKQRHYYLYTHSIKISNILTIIQLKISLQIKRDSVQQKFKSLFISLQRHSITLQPILLLIQLPNNLINHRTMATPRESCSTPDPSPNYPSPAPFRQT